MITKVELTEDYIEDIKPFLEKVQKSLVESLKLPIGILLGETEQQRRTRIIIENLSESVGKVENLLIIPGHLIQVIHPVQQLIITILFLTHQGNTKIDVQINKLEYQEDLYEG